MIPKTREELDTLVCTAPGCGCGGVELFLRAKCHPHAPLDVSYTAGEVRVACRRCKTPVVTVAVASATEELLEPDVVPGEPWTDEQHATMLAAARTADLRHAQTQLEEAGYLVIAPDHVADPSKEQA